MGTDNPSHYFVNFIDDCTHLKEISGSSSLTISLSIKRLIQSRRGPLLLNSIKQALQANHYLQVYAWEILSLGRVAKATS